MNKYWFLDIQFYFHPGVNSIFYLKNTSSYWKNCESVPSSEMVQVPNKGVHGSPTSAKDAEQDLASFFPLLPVLFEVKHTVTKYIGLTLWAWL